MAEYIDKSVNPGDYIEVWEAEDAEHGKQIVMAVDDLQCLPPADVRSVVLCSKCRYCQKEDEYTLWCTGFCNPSRLVRPDDFCSHGEAAP